MFVKNRRAQGVLDICQEAAEAWPISEEHYNILSCCRYHSKLRLQGNFLKNRITEGVLHEWQNAIKSYIRKGKCRPATTTTPTPTPSRSGYPPLTLQRAGLESSGRRLNS